MKNSSYASAIVLGLASLSLVAVTAACGDDDDGGSSTSSSTSSTSSSGDGGGSTTSSSSSSSGSTGGVNTDALNTAMCARTVKCNPGLYADAAACVADLKADTGGTPLPGAATRTQAQVDACAAKYAGIKTCDGFFAFPECTPAGTGAADAVCLGGSQCSGGACAKTAAGDKCGKCAAAVAKDGACNQTDKQCAAGLLCLADKCTEYLAKGADCTAANGFLCTDSKCIGGKCADPAAVGGDCGAAFSDCASELACDAAGTKKCVAKAVKNLGDDCDTAKQDICKSSRCDATKKCVAYAKATEACTPTGFECDPTSLACGADGKCAVPAAPTCP